MRGAGGQSPNHDGQPVLHEMVIADSNQYNPRLLLFLLLMLLLVHADISVLYMPRNIYSLEVSVKLVRDAPLLTKLSMTA
jgi:hypothetical protein